MVNTRLSQAKQYVAVPGVVNDVLRRQALALGRREAVLNDKSKKRLAVHAKGLECPMHAARAFPLPPRGQQFWRNQLMTAALVGTFAGLSLNGGC